MRELITNKLSVKQINEINSNINNLPRELTNKEKRKRVSMDIIVFILMTIYTYINLDFSIEFLLVMIFAITLFSYIIYFHTSESKNYIMDLLSLRFRGNLKTKSHYKITLDNNRLIISRDGKNYSNIYKLLDWNDLTVCVIETEEKDRKLAFLNLSDNDKDEFSNEAKKIYDLSLELVDKDKNLNDFLK